jgi:site-specific DNA-methyltransferase (adenine-specific)
MTSMREYLGETSMMAYLTMMAPRLLELRRVLKDTGSIYLHCDPTASHYLKILMDGVFGPANYRNEIAWKRQTAHSDARLRFANVSDRILFYAKTNANPFRPTYTAHDPKYVAAFYRFDDHDGRGLYQLDNMTSPNPRPNMTYTWKGFEPPTKGWRYQTDTMARLDTEGRIWYPTKADGSPDTSKRPRLKRYLAEQEGSIISDVWTDINPIGAQAAERMGYPTQKPQALLERIIQASSNEGDVVLDPFCGCGTAVAAAQKLNRQWVGIDITYLSIDLIAGRLRKTGLTEGKDFVIKGAPADVLGADQLAARAPFQFQYWALSRIPGAMPSDRKTGDHGVDGVLHFWDPAKASKAGKGIISVKGTIAVNPGMVRDLAGTVDHQDADFGILVTLQEPTEGMRTEARKAGVYKYNNQREIPRLQLVSAADLFKEFLPLQLPPEEVRNGRKMTGIAEPGADEVKGELFGE